MLPAERALIRKRRRSALLCQKIEYPAVVSVAGKDQTVIDARLFEFFECQAVDPAVGHEPFPAGVESGIDSEYRYATDEGAAVFQDPRSLCQRLFVGGIKICTRPLVRFPLAENRRYSIRKCPPSRILYRIYFCRTDKNRSDSSHTRSGH